MTREKILCFALDVLFPPRCANCEVKVKTNAYPLCANCEKSLPINTSLFCAWCGARAYSLSKVCHAGAPCVLGAATRFDRAAAQRIIHAIKYENKKFLAHPLGKIIAGYFDRLSAEVGFDNLTFFVIPVPIHKKKILKRGYNQSALLAREFIKQSNKAESLFFVDDIIFKTKNTPSQTECKTRAERLKNIAGSFETRVPELIRGKNLIIIDDVCTTGSTVSEIARLLKKSGARIVLALVFAKA